MAPENNRKDWYKSIKIVGFISYIPVVMVTGPLAALFGGMYLKNKFGLPRYAVFILIIIGFVVSGIEAARIIRRVSLMEKKENG